MKAVKKPIPIEVEEFQPSMSVWPMCCESGQGDYAGQYVVYNALHGSYIQIKPGDYINVTDRSGRDIYPIDRETFYRTYEVLAEPQSADAVDPHAANPGTLSTRD